MKRSRITEAACRMVIEGRTGAPAGSHNDKIERIGQDVYGWKYFGNTIARFDVEKERVTLSYVGYSQSTKYRHGNVRLWAYDVGWEVVE